MKQKSKSKSGNKTQKNHNQGGYFNEPKTFPSKSKSNGAKEQFYNAGNATHNSNENAWGRSRHSSVSDMWSDADEHFPALGASAASGPKVNVWEERKTKQEAIKALEPQNEYDEEAMLQHVLALSLLEATEEEQRKKKLEEDYMMQMETLQFSSEDVEDFDAPEEFIMEQASNVQDDFSVKKQHELENYSRNSVSKSNQKEKTYNCEETKIQDGCSMKEEYQLENHSRHSISNNSQKEKNYNSVGARPKINKAIEAFGGWGLKDNKKRNNSEKITEFIDDVVSERSYSYNKTPNDQKNKSKHTKENSFSNEENSLHNSDAKNNKKSSLLKESDEKDEFLYDEEGTFLDYDDNKWSDSKYENVKLQCVSPNAALDTWLNTKDANDLNDEILNKNKVITVNGKKSDNFIPPSSFNDKPKIDDTNEIMPTSNEFSISTITRDFECKSVKDPEALSQETSEPIKNVWSNTPNFKDQELLENKNAYNYDACNLNANSFTPFHEPTEVPTLTSCKIWSDKSSSDSSYFSSFSDNLTSKLESVKLSSDIDNEVFNVASCNDSDDAPIPPPQPPATALTVNECNGSATGIPNSNCEIESPSIPQSQSVPEVQFPPIVNPILNPMFPALNPMFGCGVDPLLMRQMLILTNPFLANQLIAMEQYYRSMGIPVDLFSMSPPMPNVSGMLNPLPLQNTLASNVNGNIQQLQSEIQHLQTQIDANAASVNENTTENLEQVSCEKSHETPGMDAFLDFSKSAASEENSNDDPWFKSYLSNDDASIIPPPKPPSNEVNCNDFIPVPQKSESSQIDSNYDKYAHSHISDSPAVHMSHTSENKEFRPLAGHETCITKKEVDGWGDPEDDFADAQSHKTNTWDDGWGDPNAPPEPILRNRSLQEDKKKTAFRQPAKQPQIGRYQKNFSYR